MKNKFSLLLFVTMFALMHFSGYAQDKVVRGTITDVSGLPIPGVSVIVKGTTTGVSTDFDGKYSISVPVGQVLVFSSTGTKKVERTVGSSAEIDVKLEDDISQLKEVIVVGYGTVKKVDVTGAISNVTAEQLMTRPVSNVLDALQGKAAGVDIRTSERPGTVGAVRIRGNRSITATNEPLYVVDGVPLMSKISGNGNVVNSLNSGGIGTLNPRDIETIDILKDASATAIYGSRGANGVIIITTKQGKNGQFKLDYVGSVTVSEIVDRSPSMSAADFIDYRRWAAYNLDATKYANPKTPTYDNDKLIFDSALDGQTSRDNVLRGWESGSWDASKVVNTDWTDIVTKSGITRENVISASGGSEKVNTYASLGYLSQEGTQRGQSYDRYTAKLSSNINPVSWFKMAASLNISWSEQEYGMSTLGARSGTAPNAIYGAAKSIYNIAVPYDANGKLLINPGGESGIYTIMDEWDKSSQNAQNMRVLGSFSGTFDIGKIWEPLKGLNYKIGIGPDYNSWREGVYIDGTSSLKVNADGSTGTNYARLRNERDLSWTVDNIITYDRDLGGKNKIGVTLLQTASAWDTETSSMSANNIPKPSFLWNAFNTVDITNPANSASMSSGLVQRQLNSYMARVNYIYDSRYLLTMSGRWDGVSQLADGHKWDFFPSAALAWRIDQEDFMKEVDWVDNLKVRFSYGVVGNSSVAPYATKGDVSSVYLPFNGMSNQIGYTTNEPYYTNTQLKMPNPFLGWEKTTQYNFGLDFGVLDNRINGTLEMYQTYTDDLILDVKIPSLSGYPVITSNIGETTNHGVELTLNFVPFQSDNGFNWESSFTGSWQKDEIVGLANGKNDMPDNAWFIGESIAVRYGYDNGGMWQDTPEDIAEMAKWNANGYKFTPGNVRPIDQDGDYKMTAADRTVLGNSNPYWTMGWMNTFEYQGIDLAIQIYGRAGYVTALGGEALTSHANQRETDYWTPDNTGAEFQKPILGQASSGSQDPFSGLLGFQYASFVKIQNISLGYNFDRDFTKKIGLSNLRLYTQVQSPGSLYQSLRWYDLDTDATYFNRSVVMGIQVGF